MPFLLSPFPVSFARPGSEGLEMTLPLSIRHVQIEVNGTDFDIAVGSHESDANFATGLTIVWVHGLGNASTTTFREISLHPALDGWPSVLIDLPGSGHSPAPEDWNATIEEVADIVLATITRLDLSPVVLFGHSMGGSVAIAAAQRRPDLIRHLVVAEPNLDPGVGATSAAIARQAESAFVSTGFRNLVQATERLARQGNHAAARWLLTLRETDPTTLHRLSSSLLAPRTPTFREMIGALPMPVAFISGERSGDRGSAPQPCAGLTGYVVYDAGHQMFEDNPDAFAAILARLVGETSRER